MLLEKEYLLYYRELDFFHYKLFKSYIIFKY